MRKLRHRHYKQLAQITQLQTAEQVWVTDFHDDGLVPELGLKATLGWVILAAAATEKMNFPSVS